MVGGLSLKYFTLPVCIASDHMATVMSILVSPWARWLFPAPIQFLSRFSLPLVFCTLHRMCSSVVWGGAGIYVFGFGSVVWKILAHYRLIYLFCFVLFFLWCSIYIRLTFEIVPQFLNALLYFHFFLCLQFSLRSFCHSKNVFLISNEVGLYLPCR